MHNENELFQKGHELFDKRGLMYWEPLAGPKLEKVAEKYAVMAIGCFYDEIIQFFDGDDKSVLPTKWPKVDPGTVYWERLCYLNHHYVLDVRSNFGLETVDAKFSHIKVRPNGKPVTEFE